MADAAPAEEAPAEEAAAEEPAESAESEKPADEVRPPRAAMWLVAAMVDPTECYWSLRAGGCRR